MCRNKLNNNVCSLLALVPLAAMSLVALAKDVTMTFTTPSNRQGTNVKVTLDPYNSAIVTIPAGSTVTQKRDLIRDKIKERNPNLTVEDVGHNGLKIKDLHDNTNVEFDPGKTGEANDKIACAAPVFGSTSFVGDFDPFGWDGDEAVFTAGIMTDRGELTAHVTAAELGYQTSGWIICEALFQRLAPSAPEYGAMVNYAGDRLEVYFDPAYTVEQGGVVFGTTSMGEGCLGSLNIGESSEFRVDVAGACPGEVFIDWSGATPSSQMGLLYAASEGAYVIPNSQPCAGTVLGLSSRNLQLVRTLSSGPDGSGHMQGHAGASVCGGFIQLVVIDDACSTSNAAPLPGG